MAGPLGALLGAVPAGVEIGRDQAREDAVRELSDSRYAADDPNLVERGFQWLVDRITDLLDRAGSVTPGGAFGVILIGTLVIALAVALWFGSRAVLAERSSRTGIGQLFDEAHPLTAREHRELAERATASGDHSAALREWFRAAVRGLEERGLLDPRPGRTADEAALEIGVLFTAAAQQATTAARRFDAVAFGDAIATADDASRARSLDELVRRDVPTATVR